MKTWYMVTARETFSGRAVRRVFPGEDPARVHVDRLRRQGRVVEVRLWRWSDRRWVRVRGAQGTSRNARGVAKSPTE